LNRAGDGWEHWSDGDQLAPPRILGHSRHVRANQPRSKPYDIDNGGRLHFAIIDSRATAGKREGCGYLVSGVNGRQDPAASFMIEADSDYQKPASELLIWIETDFSRNLINWE
jgi:hypothetical protein